MKTAHLSPFSYWSERFFIFFWQPRTQEVYACCERPIKMELLLWRCDVLIRFFLCVCHTLVLRRDLLRCYSCTEAGKIKRKKREFTLTHRVFSPPVSSLRAFFSSYRCSPLLSAYRYVTSWTALSFLFSSPSKHLFVCLFSFNTQRAHLYVQNQLRSLCISNVSQLRFFFFGRLPSPLILPFFPFLPASCPSCACFQHVICSRFFFLQIYFRLTLTLFSAKLFSPPSVPFLSKLSWKVEPNLTGRKRRRRTKLEKQKKKRTVTLVQHSLNTLAKN